MLLLRDYGTMALADVLKPAIYYAGEGQPLVERASFTIGTVEQLFREHWPTSAAVYLPGGKVPAPGTLFANKQLAETYSRILREAESVGGNRDKQIEHARKMWSHGFVAEAIDRFCRTQDIMDFERRAPPRRADRRRHGALSAARRGAGHLPVRPLHRLQGRVLEPGSGGAAAARAAQGLRSRRRRSDQRRFHPHRGRVREARLRRPRDLLRRSGLREGARRRAVVGRLQRRAAQARRPGGVARAAPRQHPGLRHAARDPRARRPAPGRARRRRADGRAAGVDARRHRSIRASSPSATAASSNAPASCAATPCISTSSTATAT